MPRILIVDDEARYRTELAGAFPRHETLTAANGQEAIALGSRFRPQILVVDWLLKDHIHGLQVAQALRVVDPGLRTIVITGFASTDLRRDAESLQVFDFIEKPFDLTTMEGAVDRALEAEEPDAERLPVGVLTVDGAGRITFANWRARELLSATRAGAQAPGLAEIFGPEAARALTSEALGWTSVEPFSRQKETWYARYRPWAEEPGGLVILLPHEERAYRSHPTVGVLADLPGPPDTDWPCRGHVLVVDADESARGTLTGKLRSAGCNCHSAEDGPAALRLLANDSDVRFVLLDYDSIVGTAADLLARIRAARPDAVLVGCSASPRSVEFAGWGVEIALVKPVGADDFVNAATGRIGKCVDCGLPVPLRRPRKHDQGASWICRGCGSRYYAVLDESFPAHIVSNVKPAEGQ